MFLTDTEVVRLTNRRRPKAQIRWLEDRGWPYTTDADGRPVVLISALNDRLHRCARRKDSITPSRERGVEG